MALFGLGSKSSDFSPSNLADNPLPPCPDSANCIRIGRRIKSSKNTVLKQSIDTLRSMQPHSLSINDQKDRIHCVFNIFIFRDDLTVLLAHAATHSLTKLYLRSASRTGAIDFGVNRRRVQTFLTKMNLRH